MVTTSCGQCGMHLGLVAVKASTFPDFLITCPSGECERAPIRWSGFEGFEEVEIQGIEVEKLPSLDLSLAQHPSGMLEESWPIVHFATGAWGRVQAREAGDPRLSARVVGLHLEYPRSELILPKLPADLPIPLGIWEATDRLYTSRPREESWWQDPLSGEVFTIVHGVWIWVRPLAAYPVRLPLVPVLRKLD